MRVSTNGNNRTPRFSNGCTVGCEQCDGTNNHFGHGFQKFRYNGMTAAELLAKNITLDNPWLPPPGTMVLDPNTTQGLVIAPNCKNPQQRPTICDTRLRTCNSQAECGSDQDVYYWRCVGA
jgi:hypothetical protein